MPNTEGREMELDGSERNGVAEHVLVIVATLNATAARLLRNFMVAEIGYVLFGLDCNVGMNLVSRSMSRIVSSSRVVH